MNQTTNIAETATAVQVSLLDDLLAQLNDAGQQVSSSDITVVINQLLSAREQAKIRENRLRKKAAKEAKKAAAQDAE